VGMNWPASCLVGEAWKKINFSMGVTMLRKEHVGWRIGKVIECLPVMSTALGSSPNTSHPPTLHPPRTREPGNLLSRPLFMLLTYSSFLPTL
jgi:hypothetical protein